MTQTQDADAILSFDGSRRESIDCAESHSAVPQQPDFNVENYDRREQFARR
jgi:hypothetical protein